MLETFPSPPGQGRPNSHRRLSWPNLTGESNAGEQTCSRSTNDGAVTRLCYTESLWHTGSAALNAQQPQCQHSLAVLGAQREERASVLGVCCVVPVNSWHMILQGLVPSGSDESLSCYTLPLSEIGIWKNITKLWLVCWYKFDFWTTKLLLKITFSGLSST